MNKTVFYAVKAWVSKLISGVERHIKAVEKDVQKINKKLPNFLTRNYTTDKDINLVSQDIGQHLTYSEWRLNEVQEFRGSTEFWTEGATIMCELFTEPKVLSSISEDGTPNIDGFYLMFSGGALIFYSSVVWVYGEVEMPVGWSIYHYDEATGGFAATPLTTPPIVRFESDQESDIYDFLDYHATLVEEKWGEYAARERLLDLYESYIGIYAGNYDDDKWSFFEAFDDGDGVRVYSDDKIEIISPATSINGLVDPINDTDAANKAYVDGKLTLNNGTIYQNGVDVTAQVKAALGIT